MKYQVLERMSCNCLTSFSEQIAARIGAEIKRMHRRKQLQHHHSHRSTSSPSPPSTPPHVHASVSDHTEMQSVDAQPSCSPPGMSSSTQTFFAGPSSPSQRKDVPLFTFKCVLLRLIDCILQLLCDAGCIFDLLNPDQAYT